MKHIIFKLLSVMFVILIVAAAIGCGKKAAEKATPTPTAIPTPTATPAEPSGNTGSLSNLTGDVQVLRSWGSSWIAAASGMKIGTGDNLKTGSDGYALITFFDGSVMEVESDSEISVEELSKASGGSTTVRIGQVLGNTINRVENLVDSSSTYEVETPAGSAVVRGTTERIQVGASGRTCTTVDDEEDAASHSAVFTARGVSQAIVEGFTSCCEVGGIPGTPFHTDSADDPFQGGDGGGGGGHQPHPSSTPTQCAVLGGDCRSIDCCEGMSCLGQFYTCCLNNEQECENDLDCCGGFCCDYSCSSEQCGGLEPPDPECYINEDCPDDEPCIDGVCVYE